MVEVLRLGIQTERLKRMDPCGTVDRQVIGQRGILDRRAHRETEFRRVQRI